MYKPETYEERADHAEYKVERLEGMLFSFFHAMKQGKTLQLDKLKEDWDEYEEEFYKN